MLILLFKLYVTLKLYMIGACMHLNASKMNQCLLMADQSSQYIFPFSANLILQSSIGEMNYGLCFVLP